MTEIPGACKGLFPFPAEIWSSDTSWSYPRLQRQGEVLFTARPNVTPGHCLLDKAISITNIKNEDATRATDD